MSVIAAAWTSSVIPASGSSQGWHVYLFPEGLVRFLWFSVCLVILVSMLHILSILLGDSSGEHFFSWFCFSVRWPSWAQAILGLLLWVMVPMLVPLIGASRCCFRSLPRMHGHVWALSWFLHWTRGVLSLLSFFHPLWLTRAPFPDVMARKTGLPLVLEVSYPLLKHS